MSGLSGGLAPIGSAKKPTRSSGGSDLGNALDDALSRPPRNAGIDESFDSFNSASFSETSFPSPTPAKSKNDGAGGSKSASKSASKAMDYLNSSGEVESFHDLDSSGAYELPSSGNRTARPNTSGGVGLGVGSREGEDNSGGVRPQTADNNNDDIDDLESSTGGSGYAFGTGRSRQRRSLTSGGASATINSNYSQNQSNTNSSSTGGNGGATASLDELDRHLYGGGGAPISVGRSKLAAQIDSDNEDDSYMPSKASMNKDPVNRSGESNLKKDGNPSKGLSVRIDPVESTTSNTASSMSAASYDYEDEGGRERSPSQSYDPTARYELSSTTPNRQPVRNVNIDNTSGLNSSPAWLNQHGANVGQSSINPRSPKNIATTINNSDRHAYEQTIRNQEEDMQQKSLQSEARERQMRMEIERLKAEKNRSNFGLGNLTDEQIKELGEGSVKHLRETADLKRQLAQQDMEISRLKDESTLQTIKHHEEIKYLNEKHEMNLRDLNSRKEEEVSVIEKRHNEAISALKRIHVDEINAIRERSKENAALDQLTSQLKSASGSIKLLEEQLLSKYKGLDAAKDGQLEARERLLSEMEERARTRVDNAESEGYRLKGLLMHMEHVAGSMRSSSGEEKERLRQEHQRLHSLQLALEAERNSFQSRVSEELLLLKKKMEELDVESKRLVSEKREQLESFATQQRTLDADRAEFANYVIGHTKSAEATAEQLRNEETRLRRAREEVEQDKVFLEQKRSNALSDIRQADKVRTSLQSQRDAVEHEKTKLQHAVTELNAAAQNLSIQGEALEKQSKVLDAREVQVREGNASLKIAQSKLLHQQKEFEMHSKEMEVRRQLMQDQQQDLAGKRIELAKLQRFVSNTNQQIAQTNLENIEGSDHTSSSKKSKTPPKKARRSMSPSRNNDEEQALVITKPETDGPSNDNGAVISDWLRDFRTRISRTSAVNNEERRFEQRVNNELSSARRSTQSLRSDIDRMSSTRQQVDRFLQEETPLVSKLKATKTKAQFDAGN
jgi:hypothetical protein